MFARAFFMGGLLLAVASAGPSDAADFEAALAALDARSFDAKTQAVAALEKQADRRARPILEAMLRGALFRDKASKRFVIGEEDGRKLSITDAVTAEPLGQVKKRRLKKIAVNSRLRGRLQLAIAILSLNDSDPAVRAAAASSLIRYGQPTILASLDRLIAAETDRDVRATLVVARHAVQAKAGRAIPLSGKGVTGACSAAHFGEHFLSECQAGPRGAAVDPAAGKPAPVTGTRSRQKNGPAKAGDSAARIAAIAELSGVLDQDVMAVLGGLSQAASAEDPAIGEAARGALAVSESKGRLYGVLETLFFGVSLGSVLLLAAAGLAITFGVMGVINMAHGEMIMLGAYTTYVVQQALPEAIEYSLAIAIPAAFLVSGTAGVLIERGIIRFLYGRPLETLLATFGLSLILQQLVRVVFSPLNRSVRTPEWMSGAFEINAALTLTYNRMTIILFTAVLLVGIVALMRWVRFSCGGGNYHGDSGIIISLHAAFSPFRDKIWPHTGVLSANPRIDRIPCHQCIEITQFYSTMRDLHPMRYTSFGLHMRAVTQNRQMASAMGIPTQRVDAFTFGFGSGIAGIAGVALSQLTNVGPNLGTQYIVDSFMVVVFGGVGNLWGTVVGAMTLGVANKLLELWSGAVLGKILILVFIILFIQRRPSGMFAMKGRAAEN